MTSERRIATWAAAVTAVAATLALGIGVFTPPRGGLLCTSGCIPCLSYSTSKFLATSLYSAPGCRTSVWP